VFRSLRAKIIVATVATLIASFGTFTYFTLNRARKGIDHLTIDTVSLLSSTIKRALGHAMVQGRSRDVEATVDKVTSEPGILRVRIFDESGRILISSDRDKIGGTVGERELSVLKSPRPLVVKKQKVYTHVSSIENEHECHRCHGSENAANGALSIDFSLAHFSKELVSSQAYIVLVSAATLIVVSVLIALIVWYFVNRPIRELMNGMSRVESGDLSVRVRATSRDEIGRVARHFNTMLDTVESAQAEITRYHDEKMNRAERLASIGQIASGLAHEIKNPLAGISGAIDTIARGLDRNDPRGEIFAEIKVQIRRITKVVTDLLMFARDSRPDMKPTNVGGLIADTLLLVQQQKDSAGVRFEQELSPDLPQIEVDRDGLRQVLLNIYLNALQAMPHGGTLKTKTYLDQRSENCVIAVSDTGQGMEREQLARIFEPFYTTKHYGTGLGLSNVDKVLKEQGGNVFVASEPGRGTLFRVSLPTRRPDASASPRKKAGDGASEQRGPGMQPAGNAGTV
jgi:signal transduction histidine kinase